MSDFRKSIEFTLVHEGGFQKLPKDSGNWTGGAIGVGELKGTKYGISAAQFPNLDIQNLTVDQAVEIYREGYWKSGYSQISSQLVADKLFDLGVLFGVHEAISIMQQTLENDFHVTVDGVFGNETLGAIEQCEETSLLKSYEANMTTHAFNIITKKPEKREFIQNWCGRIGCSLQTPCVLHR
jgi:lysozyme family protein